MTINIGVRPDEMGRSDAISLYVATRIMPAPKREKGFRGKASPERTASYGAILIGNGQTIEMWGAGYATFEDFLRAEAALRGLDALAEGQVLDLHTRGLIKSIEVGGYVELAAGRGGYTVDGKPCDGFAPLSRTHSALKASRLRVHNIPNLRDPPPEYSRAIEIASELAWEVAGAYRAVRETLAEANPRNFVVATDDDPDPMGVVAGQSKEAK